MEAVLDSKDVIARAEGARVVDCPPELEHQINLNRLNYHYAEARSIAADFERRYVTRASGDKHRGG